MWGGQLDVKQI